MKFLLPSLRLNIKNSTFLFKLVCACWLITKLICYKLWFAQRFFPLVPVHDSLLVVPPLIHSFLFAISLACMLAFCLVPRRNIIVILLVCEVLSCLLDQNRWQPWEYQFVCMLGVYLFVTGEKKRIHTWQLIIIGIYFFSGLNKCSSYFIHNVWNHLFLKEFAGIHNAGPWLLRTGYLIPLFELTAAVALCFEFTRKKAVWFLCSMHLLNLLLLGPSGININAAIWPWNLLMPFLLIALFYKQPVYLFEKAVWKHAGTWLMLVAWWILPWLQFAGLWDKYLSGVLYSGRTEQLYICTNDLAAVYRLPGCITLADKNMECKTVISVYKWAMREISVPPYPEIRVYRAIAASWNKAYPGAINRFYLYQGGFTTSVKPLLP